MNRRKLKKSTSIYKGVYFDKKNKKWKSHIKFEKQWYNLGSFKEEKEAAIAYNIKAEKLFKEFAYLNEV